MHYKQCWSFVVAWISTNFEFFSPAWFLKKLFKNLITFNILFIKMLSIIFVASDYYKIRVNSFWNEIWNIVGCFVTLEAKGPMSQVTCRKSSQDPNTYHQPHLPYRWPWKQKIGSCIYTTVKRILFVSFFFLKERNISF